MAKKLESELLKLLNARAAWNLPPYKVPEQKPVLVHEAMRLHTLVHDSDPFAKGRIRLYLQQGYTLASDEQSDSSRALQRRDNEPKGGFAKLADLKKKQDQDRAWNQFRSARYQEEKAA